MKIEHRDTPATEVRVTEQEGEHYFEARVINYSTLDDFGTTFSPGVFKESLEQRMPAALWGHSWSDPIGKVVSYTDNADGLDVRVKFASFEVPEARKAYHLLKDGIITQFSVGFARETAEPDPNHRGAMRITKALLPEISPVLMGSNPNTSLLSVRTSVETTTEPATDVETILNKLAAKEITVDEALSALALNGTTVDEVPPVVEDPTPEELAEVETDKATAANELAQLDRLLGEGDDNDY